MIACINVSGLTAEEMGRCDIVTAVNGWVDVCSEMVLIARRLCHCHQTTSWTEESQPSSNKMTPCIRRGCGGIDLTTCINSPNFPCASNLSPPHSRAWCTASSLLFHRRTQSTLVGL